MATLDGNDDDGVKQVQQSLFAGVLTTHLMNQLQQRVAECGVCPSCHARTLRVLHEALGMSFEQCEKCLCVYVLPCGVA